MLNVFAITTSHKETLQSSFLFPTLFPTLREGYATRKQALVDYTRRHLRWQHLRLGEGSVQMTEFESMLDPDAFVIGFARRFATYKRATLIFRDPERLARILNHPERPVQIVFAGKAHPADEAGKALIQQVYRFSRSDQFRGKVVLLENYDIEMARYLVSGTDLWLNNPIRPHEASGTSGQKAALNGQPNCSILDGWWAEGYNGKNGWAIGEEREYHDPEVQAEADSLSLYQVLEEQIIPAYYDRGPDNLPHGWSLGEGVDVSAWVRTDDLQKEDLAVELVYGEARDDLILPDQTLPMNYIKKESDGSMRYAVHLRPSETGSVGYGVRVLPTHPALPRKYDMGLVRWA